MANESSKIHSSSVFFIVFSMVSIFLTGAILYVCGEFFFFFYKGIPVSFSSNIILFLGKIGIYIGSFTGLMLWIANLLKK
ncbi:hypothetical protein [Escherichia coli]|uniref:hypothetical protein n=2 Tax=Escherichia coli TaxID=562 RepID=UPI002023A0D6|nr:hypothetical protein [Escherichia coli]MED6350995.1 hypothetical protein [Escherichia coli O157]MCT6228342.1 hypothetical protein [Escherichia coli]MDI1177094.1 hypothetical protein [Escherichia coli]MED6415827.1 hypothetical protein [Escherichia coli O157]MED6861843.1 hypothetical protein [Escherichia coli O157]